MKNYDHKSIEKRWQDYWAKEGLHKTPDSGEKMYVLDMFPYPSGSGLHVGHVEGYTATDIYSRYWRMHGRRVLHPMGWDAFGLPAENYAIKTGVHPSKTTTEAQDTFRSQMNSVGFSYDWSRELDTSSPEYYKWTQWIFAEFFKNDLAEKKVAKVNWCPSCNTVLANEQVVNGGCERCGSEVIQKDLSQWFFKITKYADQLIEDLDQVDWPESTKISQRNWVGRSEGAHIEFAVDDSYKLKVFTTRPDTLFGATYMVVAPDHELVKKYADQITNMAEVEAYQKETDKKTELERTSSNEKTGVKLEGITATNPTNNAELPVFIADYVLSHYGTGAIMAVPAHDERDFEFAQKFDLPIIQVVDGESYAEKEAFVAKNGVLVNSGEFDGYSVEEVKKKITEHVGGEMVTTYRLRDWLIGRQRYWGAPIPIVYDPQGNPHAVPEEHLPWVLPTDVEFKPTGVAPLADSQELKDRVESIFGKGWTPEVDTLDTFMCSSWYMFRFADPHNTEVFADKEKVDDFLPVDVYVGGAEHTVLHLLYARFFTKALRDLGYLNFDEPFLKLRHPGMVLAEGAEKMSKSKGNVVNPNDMVENVGADALRVYEMFMGPFDQPVAWSTDNMIGSRRFLERFYEMVENHALKKSDLTDDAAKRIIEKTIDKVSKDIERFSFNTAVSQLMICTNECLKIDAVSVEDLQRIVAVIAPFAPHIAEELWQGVLLQSDSVHRADWPKVESQWLIDDSMTMAVQVNGKVRAEIEFESGASDDYIKETVLKNEDVQRHIDGKEVRKIIIVPKKLVSIVL